MTEVICRILMLVLAAVSGIGLYITKEERKKMGPDEKSEKLIFLALELVIVVWMIFCLTLVIFGIK